MDHLLLKLFGLTVFGVVPLAPLIYFIVRKTQARRLGIKGTPSGWMAVIGVLAIYSSLGVLYLGFKLHSHPRCNQAKTNLGAIFTTQVSYFGETNAYADTFAELHWEPEGRSFYAYYIGEDKMENNENEPVPFSPEENWPFTVRPGADAHGFTAIAIGNIDGDSFYDAWSFNDAKTLVHLMDDNYDEDLTGFLAKPRLMTREMKWRKFRDQVEGLLQFAAPFVFIIFSALGLIFMVHSEVRWRKMKHSMAGGQP